MTLGTILIDDVVSFAFMVLACLITQRFGIFNLAIESVVINSTFSYACWVSTGHGVVTGGVIALVSGVATAGIFATMAVLCGLDQIVSGIALNMLSLGITTVFMQDITGSDQVSFLWVTAEAWRLPLIVVLICLSIAVWYLLSKSIFGPRALAIEEDTYVARSCDLQVKAYQAWATVASGIVGAFGGIYLALRLSGFNNNQWKLGTGYLALAIVVAVQGKIGKSLWLAGLLSVLSTVAQKLPAARSSRVPGELLDMSPYILVILLFCFVHPRTRSLIWRTMMKTTTSVRPDSGG